MNKLQATQFEILKTFIDICEKLNLDYFLVCGSVLGATKYGGFIPWDDDIDVALYREDYIKFCQYAERLLPNYYFLQNSTTDPKFPTIYSKIRDSRTTYIEKSVSNLEINHGVYIDVFPLDGYPKNKLDTSFLELKKSIFKLMLGCNFNFNENYSIKAKLFFKIERILGVHKLSHLIAKKYERTISKWSIKTSDLICNHGNWQGKLEYAPKWQYGEGIWVDFEGIKVRIPQQYDEYLTQKYGDWRAELPKEKQVGHHHCDVLDLNQSYVNYMDTKL